MAYIKLEGKAKLRNDVNQLEVRVKQAQDELNRKINGKPLVPGTPAYIAADKKFQDAVANLNTAKTALANYVEPKKPKTAKQIEAERQQAILENRNPEIDLGLGGQAGDTLESINTDLDAKVANARQFLFDLGEKGRKELSQTLKDANFPVEVEGKFPNDSLLTYYVNSLKAVKSQNETNKDVVGYVPVKWDSYVSNLISSGTGDGAELPDPFGTQQIYNKSTAEGVIDNLFQSFLKRDASESEINSLFKELQAEQKKLSSMSKGTYKMINGRQVLVKEEGLDPRVFLENKIKELPAYKESQAAKSEQNKLSLASTALANGYDLERDFSSQLPSWLDAINKGESISKFQSTIRNSARLALPEAVRSSIDPNEDLTTAFATYISNYSKTFGVPASQVPLNKILPLATNDKGFIPIYEFEKKKRQLADWDITQEARTETANVVSTVLKDFGFKG